MHSGYILCLTSLLPFFPPFLFPLHHAFTFMNESGLFAHNSIYMYICLLMHIIVYICYVLAIGLTTVLTRTVVCFYLFIYFFTAAFPLQPLIFYLYLNY